MNNAKTYLFDFGNVIIDINVDLTYQEFSKLTRKPVEKIRDLFNEMQVFKRYEVNEFQDDEFRDFIRSLFYQPLTDAEIDLAWNALILEIPKERIEILENLKKRHTIALLSNTNNIHIEYSNKHLKSKYGYSTLGHLFHEAIYSYELELWKPDPSIYSETAKILGKKPADIIFFDDREDNIESAKSYGYETVLIKPNEFTIVDYFKDFVF